MGLRIPCLQLGACPSELTVALGMAKAMSGRARPSTLVGLAGLCHAAKVDRLSDCLN